MASHLLPLGASSTNASSAVGALPETLVSGVFNSAEAAHQMVTASLFELLIRKPDFKSKFIDPNDPNELLMSTIQMSSGARAPVGAHERFEEKIMRSREYADGPGEIDMLIGFFLMNGMCIAGVRDRTRYTQRHNSRYMH
ncbi:hypothetical protein L596_028161 [Steinernema carpocapsae]|uniref:Uncharacterized protein n=1 Tax=Steinernema carpocapsae TaxID=34508 RepID=A0A4U5LXL2_STECR|nr:hypothetical protein L596_028161 [Steinernema carpocapsae]